MTWSLLERPRRRARGEFTRLNESKSSKLVLILGRERYGVVAVVDEVDGFREINLVCKTSFSIRPVQRPEDLRTAIIRARCLVMLVQSARQMLLKAAAPGFVNELVLYIDTVHESLGGAAVQEDEARVVDVIDEICVDRNSPGDNPRPARPGGWHRKGGILKGIERFSVPRQLASDGGRYRSLTCPHGWHLWGPTSCSRLGSPFSCDSKVRIETLRACSDSTHLLLKVSMSKSKCTRRKQTLNADRWIQ